MFDIEFIADEPEAQEEGWSCLWGCTTLGDHAERFLAPLSLWSRTDYEQQWLEAARRLLAGESRTAFFTSAFQFWWAMWREGETVLVHEEFLTPDRVAALGPNPDLTRAPYELLDPRESHTEDGEPISEWQITTTDLRAFVARRAGPSVPA